MNITCCQNEVLCPYCGKRFKSAQALECVDYMIATSYREKCLHCKKELIIDFEREYWFTAEKVEDKNKL